MQSTREKYNRFVSLKSAQTMREWDNKVDVRLFVVYNINWMISYEMKIQNGSKVGFVSRNEKKKIN